MVEQYLPHTNEKITVAILQKKLGSKQGLRDGGRSQKDAQALR
jgi:hypothetical protein